jgi:hypothetical protein
MGKLLDIYGKDKKYKQVELVFPVAEYSSTIHRPTVDEEDLIEESVAGKKEDQSVWLATYVMKYLCDEPNLREADDVELFNAVRALESPDRKAILNMWESLRGNIPDTLKDLMASQLFRGMSEMKTG